MIIVDSKKEIGGVFERKYSNAGGGSYVVRVALGDYLVSGGYFRTFFTITQNQILANPERYTIHD